MCMTTIIREKIQSGGPISFCDFMEMALYYPGEGYYTAGVTRIGKNGDFYTSCFLTSLFGKLIAKQLEQMWMILGKKAFTIVEMGAGTGLLCRDILEQVKKNNRFYEDVTYYIVDKNYKLREQMESIDGNKLKWFEQLSDLPPITGCIISNELIDNFAVHQVMMKDELKEIFVEYENGFREILVPARESLVKYLDELKVKLPNNYRTEINLQAIAWMQEVAAILNKGFVVTIDYGFPSIELYSEKRRTGTLVCYHKHHVNYCPYENIGEQDITAHVNFSALHHWGTQSGLSSCGFTNQAQFLLGLGFTRELCEMERNGNGNAMTTDEKLLLGTFLQDMGRKMKVLIQQKEVGRPALMGLQFSQRLDS